MVKRAQAPSHQVFVLLTRFQSPSPRRYSYQTKDSLTIYLTHKAVQRKHDDSDTVVVHCNHGTFEKATGLSSHEELIHL